MERLAGADPAEVPPLDPRPPGRSPGHGPRSGNRTSAFMAADAGTMFSLPRTNPRPEGSIQSASMGHYTLIMSADGQRQGSPMGTFPGCSWRGSRTEAVRTQRRELILGRSLSRSSCAKLGHFQHERRHPARADGGCGTQMDRLFHAACFSLVLRGRARSARSVASARGGSC